MAFLTKTTARFLGEQDDFKKESYFEGFIWNNPLVLSSSEDAPEDYISVYIIGRQEMYNLYHKQRTGITDLTCLIWDPDLGKYQIWVYELKVYSNNANDVTQLVDYLKAIKLPKNKNHHDEIIKRAEDIVGSRYLDNNMRGALCAQAFSDDVIRKIIDENTKRSNNDKLLAVKIYRFPVDNEVFVLVEPFIGEEKTSTGEMHMTYYDVIPELSEAKLIHELNDILSNRKKSHPIRYKQLRTLLELLALKPNSTITQEELRSEWEKRKLPKDDRGLSVSQLLGYKKSGALRQILKWDWVRSDIKDNYRLRNKEYAKVLHKILKRM